MVNILELLVLSVFQAKFEVKLNLTYGQNCLLIADFPSIYELKHGNTRIVIDFDMIKC